MAKHPRMILYLDKIQELLKAFSTFTIQQMAPGSDRYAVAYKQRHKGDARRRPKRPSGDAAPKKRPKGDAGCAINFLKGGRQDSNAVAHKQRPSGDAGRRQGILRDVQNMPGAS
ncbi:unnamed protein product [Prunus armeniaca]